MKEQKGITLMALVITIIVLIILASISINMIGGNNSLINNAGKAKENSEIAEEKQIVDISTTQAMGKNKYGDLIQEQLQESVNNNARSGENIEVTEYENGLLVYFEKSNRYYLVNRDGNSDEYKPIVDSNPGNIRIGINGEELTGEESSPFEIWCIEDLVEWSQNYSSYKTSFIKLGRTLNFNSKLSYTDGKKLNCNSIDELKILLTNKEGNGYTPIAEFAGSFDGQGFEIQNIYINRTGNVGLFANIGGKVENLTLTGDITSSGNTGGIAGKSANCEIVNCTNKANITSNGNSAGGIVGYNSDCTVNIVNCCNEGKIDGKNAGGMIGYTVGSGSSVGSGEANIYNSYNIGDAIGPNAGGLIGTKWNNAATKISNSYSYSTVEGRGESPRYGELIGYNFAYNAATSAQIDNVLYFKTPVGNHGVFQSGTPTYCENITDASVLTLLNDYITNNQETTTGWRHWKKGEKGYPVFE